MESGSEDHEQEDVLRDAESGFRASRVRAVVNGIETAAASIGYVIVTLVALALLLPDLRPMMAAVTIPFAVLSVFMAWLVSGRSDRWYLLALPPRSSPLVLRHGDVEAVVSCNGVTLTTEWKINEQDEDWEWEHRDQWNAAVAGAESTLMAALWLSPALRTRSRFRQLVNTVEDALQNNF